ncbi:MAG TPA: carbohydrate ABC transporter permease [Candidatus Limnocylindria bacterium]|nr:carbohydrate ABC transporter permease [Candidatus Limnocylindria bacterium]
MTLNTGVLRRGHLLRMRQSGWFDIILLIAAAGLALTILGAAGEVLYALAMGRVTPDMNAFEIRRSIPSLAHSRGSLLGIGGGMLAGCALALLWMRFVTPLIRASVPARRAVSYLKVFLRYAAAVAYTLVILFPIYWMIISSLKTSQELLLPVPTLWPRAFAWENYPDVLARAPFGLYFFNTIVSTFFIMLGEVVIGTFAAYGFSKGRFAGKNALFILVLGALMIPIQVTFVPIYVLISRLGWMNSFPGLIVPNLVSAYFIFMLRQTFLSVDDSYLDAGRVDGMGRVSTMVHVLVPMCAPTMITISIISFINGWNSYFWPKMITTSNARRTIAVGVAHLRETFAGMETSNYNDMMAGAVLAIVPVVLLFLVLQRYIMTGFSKAAMK